MGPMETWTRPDGRFFAMNLERDLYGPAVVVWYGGAGVSRVRIVPVDDTEAGERELERLAALRRSHGYQRISL